MPNEKISLIIPAYNEAEIIADTIAQALEMLRRRFSDYELIIADDGSTDGTKEIVRQINEPALRLVSYTPNKGKGCAVRQGMLVAEGNYVAYTDADLAYGTEAVGDIIDKLVSDNADLAIGSRKLHPDGYADYPPLRLLASRAFSLITSLFAGFDYDTQCGIKAYTQNAAMQVFTRCETDGFAFDFEAVMLARGLGFSVTQLPVTIINHRESKVNVLRDSAKMFGDIIRIRRRVRARLNGEKKQ